MPAIGSRAQVMHGTSRHTSGGLTKAQLKYNKSGEIVSRKKSDKMKKRYLSMKRKNGPVWRAFKQNQQAMKANPKKFAKKHRRH